jgi:hypothetical protein
MMHRLWNDGRLARVGKAQVQCNINETNADFLTAHTQCMYVIMNSSEFLPKKNAKLQLQDRCRRKNSSNYTISRIVKLPSWDVGVSTVVCVDLRYVSQRMIAVKRI